MVKTHRQAIFIVLLGLVGLAAVGLFLTSEWANPWLRQNPAQSDATSQPSLVDQQPLVTARNLAVLAATPEEQQFAGEALRLADEEVDLAFDSALRNTAEHPIPLTPEARQLQARVKQAAARVNADQEEVARLTKLIAKAGGNQKESLGDQLQMAQDRLALDQDELDDARRDLVRAGGDEHSRLQRALDEHERTQTHLSASAPYTLATAVGQASDGKWNARSMVGEFLDWTELRAKQKQLRQALQAEKARAAELARSHDSLGREMKQKESKKEALAQQATGPFAATGGPNQVTAAALSSMRQLSQDLGDLDKRIETEQKLADVYGTWSGGDRS